MAWSLKYFPLSGGPAVQQSFAAWGIVADLPFEFASQAKSLVDIITVDDFDDAFQWEYNSKVQIFNGVTIWFQGYVAQPRRLANGARQNHRYTLYDWWWLAERTPFRRIRLSFVGGLNFAQSPPSEVVLFENDLEQPITTLLQMIEFFYVMNECWNPTRRGAGAGINPALDVVVDGDIATDLPVPRYPIRDTMTSEVGRQILAWTQDAILETDYSAAVPIVSVRRLATMPTEVVTLPADRALKLELKPRYDLQIPVVIIYYKKSFTSDGSTGTRYFQDKYPPTFSDWHPDARVHTIELVGGSQNTLSQLVSSVAIDANHATAATKVAWWARKTPWLRDERIDQSTIAISAVSVTDLAGNELLLATVLAATPNEITDGSIASWMNKTQADVIFVAAVTYEQFHDTGHLIKNLKPIQKTITVRLKATNAGPGNDILFQTIASFDPGEEVPVGLAQQIYESHQVLQYEGPLELVGNEIPANLTLGKLITINTPGGSYEDLLIQRITGELTKGTLTLYIGPPGHLGFTDMIELHRVNRYRFVYSLPSRASNPLAGGANLQLPKESPRENSTAGTGILNFDAVTATL